MLTICPTLILTLKILSLILHLMSTVEQRSRSRKSRSSTRKMLIKMLRGNRSLKTTEILSRLLKDHMWCDMVRNRIGMWSVRMSLNVLAHAKHVCFRRCWISARHRTFMIFVILWVSTIKNSWKITNSLRHIAMANCTTNSIKLLLQNFQSMPLRSIFKWMVVGLILS